MMVGWMIVIKGTLVPVDYQLAREKQPCCRHNHNTIPYASQVEEKGRILLKTLGYKMPEAKEIYT
jgi:hypothetical protein